MSTLQSLIAEFRLVHCYTIDTETDFRSGKPALIQIEAIKTSEKSIVLLNKTTYLPDPLTEAHELIKQLFTIIFDPGNEFYSWDAIKDPSVTLLLSYIRQDQELKLNHRKTTMTIKEHHQQQDAFNQPNIQVNLADSTEFTNDQQQYEYNQYIMDESPTDLAEQLNEQPIMYDTILASEDVSPTDIPEQQPVRQPRPYNRNTYRSAYARHKRNRKRHRKSNQIRSQFNIQRSCYRIFSISMIKTILKDYGIPYEKVIIDGGNATITLKNQQQHQLRTRTLPHDVFDIQHYYQFINIF
ncbi:unnamed protein product [Didymodactylos carnosus]|uniref:Uncharacterized protein n=1 Tax=Didymodactylos carnosus TaxID=1234261 RepID=A0A814SNZ7_9BILA|nr:unnamed protein product [Didymodactylos carnosus]CAF1150841.1 unnamed protein product [Didymodactylos carnosus]CAF3773312.1 unnamed protein product [Didymodactylos carnosus]CAF3914396.1 unnamed protein product [Didymodactylos carnosus]